MKFKVPSLFFILFLILSSGLSIVLKDFGVESISLKAPYLDGVFPDIGNTTYWTSSQVFTALEAQLDGEKTIMQLLKFPNSEDFVIVSRKGKIWTFSADDQTPSLILDLSDKVASEKIQGVYQIVFHPSFGDEVSEFKNDIFICYNYKYGEEDPTYSFYNRLSKFQFDEAEQIIDIESEVILISQYDRDPTHNGGAMFFGNDGFLYLTIGDEGGSYDNFNNSQKINEALFSGLIRIDVDMNPEVSHPIRRQPMPRSDRKEGFPASFTQNYFIPNDNPWINEDGENLEEFYAIGLRSPHTMSFDSESGKIIVADVGESSFEEINIIEKGSNLQWNYKEGFVDTGKDVPEVIIGTETPPIHAYGRDFGVAIIGGGIYQGDKFPELKGKYLYGDYAFKTIWALDLDEYTTEIVCIAPSQIVSYFLDGDEVYLVGNRGNIYQLEYNEAKTMPRYLSETGAFSDLESLETSEGILPYGVAAPLWSDGASKKRWVSLPNSESKVEFSSDSAWSFPKGTVFIKHFELPINSGDEAIRLETRFLVVDQNNSVYGVTYKWNDEGTDAELVLDGEVLKRELNYSLNGTEVNQTWSFPTRSQCLNCHNTNAGEVLGVRTNQLNRNYKYPFSESLHNQIELWNHLDLFSGNVSTSDLELPRLSPITSQTASNEEKVRSYLASNCSYCHQPGGVDAAFDARYKTPLYLQKIIDETVVARNSTQGNVIIKPQDKSHSELWIRDNSLESIKMPPIGKSVLDTAYLSVLEDWINSLTVYSSLNDTICEGQEYLMPNGEVKTNVTASFSETIMLEGQNNEVEVNVVVLDLKNCMDLQVQNSPRTILYPNPVENVLYLEGEVVQYQNVKLVDLGGKEQNISYQAIGDKKIRIEINSRLETGLYLLIITTNSNTIEFKVYVH